MGTYSPARVWVGKGGEGLVVHWIFWYSLGSIMGSLLTAQVFTEASKVLLPR